MWIPYPDRIAESPDVLLAQERRLRHSALSDRVKMLRLLKCGRYRSQTQLAPLLGHSDRTLRRWWRTYRQTGLSGLLADGDPGGRPGWITPPAREGLEQAMKAGQIATLEEARHFLEAQFGIRYQGVSALSRWCQRHRIKLKTGRRRHAQASDEAQVDFLK
jgi:transposase